MLTLPNYQIKTRIYESANSLVYRGIRQKDNQPVILKVLKEDYPTPEELTRYRQEYEITHDLKVTGVIKVYEIEKYQNTLVIILEDFGGESLKQLFADRPLNIKEFLPLGIAIVDSLGNIHAANIIHKDINPANIVWNKTINQLKIIDFGISSRLPRENPTLKNPEQLEGTLAYLSPEQTGRMNRSLDYRTDLYSLGVTFYELLTGKLPFESDSAMELVHCHIAKTPKPVCEINCDVPKIISDLVMKLMAKNVEDRYQSAFSVKADFEKCLENLSGLNTLDFELAQNDFSGRFQIQQKLYGRENEINTLLKVFERVSAGATEMMLVAGYSGVGKTTLVHEVHKPITEKRGYFAAGKFDQYQRNIPYFAITQAFNKFCRYLLMESAEILGFWQQKINDAVGNNGQVIIDVIPDLELVIGAQPAIAEVGPTEAQNRFQMIFLSFVKALCDKEHPFILFIDDLQWVDLGSLNLLKSILLDDEIKYLFIIGAYRDNEVDNSHPFVMTINELQKTNATINTIFLANLLFEDVNQLLQESLKCETEQAQPLTDLIYNKTQGNAFFTHQFLQTLYFDGLLRFDFDKLNWQWNVKSIKAQNITDNVVDLMTNKINKLPEKTKAVLQLAACIGNQFDLPTLAIIYKQDNNKTLSVLWEAIKEGFIQPLDENYKRLEVLDESQFKFLHDRVQQAAYALIDEEQKQAVHLKIGRLLLKNATPETLEEKVFDIVEHFNQSLSLLSSQTERLQLAQLNWKAGKKAKENTAYTNALDFLRIGMDCLGENSWDENYELSFALTLELADVLCITADFKASEKLIYSHLKKVKDPIDKNEFYLILVLQKTLEAKYSEVEKIARESLACFNIVLPVAKDYSAFKQAELNKLNAALGDQGEQRFGSLTEITNPEIKAALKMLNTIEYAFYYGNLELWTIEILIMCNLSLEYGLSEDSPYAISCYGVFLGFEPCDYVEVVFYGYDLPLEMINRYNNPNQKSRIIMNSAWVNFWKKPLRESHEILVEGNQIALSCGNTEVVGSGMMNDLYQLWSAGEPLNHLLKTLPDSLKFTLKTKNSMANNGLRGLGMNIRNLMGLTSNSQCFDDEEISEEVFLAQCLQKEALMPVCAFYINKAYSLYLYGRSQEALKALTNAESLLDNVKGLITETEFNFYQSLVMAALYDSAGKEQTVYWQKLNANQQQMKIWYEACPENFQHKYFLIEAEKARLLGQLNAIEWYEKAIKGAVDNQFLNVEALAYELAAEFYLGRGMDKFAQTYLKEAHYRYQQWGAIAKVKDLEERYPQWLAKESPPVMSTMLTSIPMATMMASTRTRTSTSQWLDLESVMKASQTLSGEIVLSQLLSKMMQIVIENAGAEHGFLILPHDDKWVIEAEGAIEKTEVTVLHSLPVENHLPEAILSYVARTQENVVLVDASHEGIYTENHYMKTHQTQSVLCFPIVYQQQLRAILYLENNLTTGAFTETRLKMLKMLSSQIAISLENAQYATQLEDKVKRRTKQLATANEKITALNERLKEENLRMSAELDVAKQIQQMVLPKKVELTQLAELDIAGFMEPADEVGGDYYEILNHEGHIKIGIGDVTGHGLESGVLMLMVQTAVRTLQISQVSEPRQFLILLNRVIYANIQRIQTDKNLTLSLLDYHEGTLQLTGQHEEVLLIRQNGQIERIDTFDLGYSVGVVVDITNWVAQTQISLQPGDGIVLYTDGITEARNTHEELYGLERLCEIVSHQWHLSAQKIQQAVIEDVRQFIGEQKVFDDITLLILKQK